MSNINERCPLQAECGKKKCSFVNNEHECVYYKTNCRPGAMLEEDEKYYAEMTEQFEQEAEE